MKFKLYFLVAIIFTVRWTYSQKVNILDSAQYINPEKDKQTFPVKFKLTGLELGNSKTKVIIKGLNTNEATVFTDYAINSMGGEIDSSINLTVPTDGTTFEIYVATKEKKTIVLYFIIDNNKTKKAIAVPFFINQSNDKPKGPKEPETATYRLHRLKGFASFHENNGAKEEIGKHHEFPRIKNIEVQLHQGTTDKIDIKFLLDNGQVYKGEAIELKKIWDTTGRLYLQSDTGKAGRYIDLNDLLELQITGIGREKTGVIDDEGTGDILVTTKL